MALNLNISENQESVPLRVGGGGLLRTISPDDGSPYYVGARAYVTQTADGATVTVIDKDGTTTANISNGQDGAAGADGQDGADGYSPTATVTKVGDTATITITDKDGTTTASISDGSGSAMAFVAAYGVDTYADVKDAYDDGVMILCSVDDSGNILLLQLVYFDDANDMFYFAVPMSDGWYLTQLSNADGWGDGYFYFASTDTATTLADGLMSALDKQKLDAIASGAEVNVQSDWSQADNTKDDYIKNKPSLATVATSGSYNDLLNKPAIPTITDTYSGTSSDGMSGKAVKSAIDALDGTISGSAGSGKTLTAFSQTDGKVSATFGNISITKSQVSDFPTIPTNTSDLYNDVPYSTVSCTRHIFSGTKIATLSIDGGSLELFAPSGGGGTVTDVTLDGTSVVSGGVAVLTSPTIPSKTSDLANDSLFARGHIASFHGTCSTGASTAEKAVTCADFKAADLVAGAIIVVSFDNANSAAVADLTLNVNSTGAYHIKYNNAGTLSNIGDKTYLKAASYMFYFDGTYWVLTGYDTNTNTVGYTIRTNGLQLPLKTVMYRYRICFTSADGEYFVPANSSTSTSATASKAVTTEKIDPFGRIVYYNTTAACAANSYPTASNLVQQYNGVTLGYSFNRTGAALTLTNHKPVYIKCAPQTDGSAIIDADNPFVQALPSTADGKIYIFLGIATAATTIEMTLEHPVYEYKNGHIREYTRASEVSVTQVTSTGTKIATISVDGTATDLYAPSGGGGTSDYDQLSNRPQINSNTLTGDKSSSDLGLAAASHSHTKSDISDFPTIPTVNNATLTIQKNSTNVATFTANASSNVTADISVPTDTNDLTNGAGFLTSTSMVSAILNAFYPVGSYYETSDTSFDPNNSWGGTWVLETEGQVHISGSSSGTYQVSGATTDTSDGGATTSATGSHTLTTDELPAHTHGSKSLSGTFTARRHSSGGSSQNISTGTGIVTITNNGGSSSWSGATQNTSASYKPDIITVNATHEHDSVGGGDAHDHGSVSTMQPYIIVNRWHRTA